MSRAYDVVVVGSLNRDYVCGVEHVPATGETVLGADIVLTAGGKGANQAAAAALLGARTAMVGRVGDDEDGAALVGDLRDAGVDTTHVLATPGVRTGMAVVMVDATGDNAIVVAPGANARVEPVTVADVVARLLVPPAVIDRPAVLVTQAEVPPDAMAAAVRTADEAGARAVVNLAPYRPLEDEVLALCDPLVVNQSEAAELTGRPITDVEQAMSAAAELTARVRSVVVTVGAAGAVVGEAGDVRHVAGVPVDPQDVVDTTGAGDAFTGALAAALAAGRTLTDAVAIGVRVGSHAVTSAGAQASYPRAADLGLDDLYGPAAGGR